jgi:hypothetical protein
MKTATWFLLLVAAGMIALSAWGSHKTVCVPEYLPEGQTAPVPAQDGTLTPAGTS